MKPEKKRTIQSIIGDIKRLRELKSEVRHLEYNLSDAVFHSGLTVREGLIAGIIKCSFPLTPAIRTFIREEQNEITRGGDTE